jgi:hypothetical protein
MHLMRILVIVLGITLSLAVLLPAFAQDGGTTPVNTLWRARVDQALAHLSNYLDLEKTITLALIEADDEDILFTSYRYDPVVYTTTALGCPQAGQTYAQRQVNAYRILLTVRGYGTYDYRVTADGSVLIFCLGGRPHSSSIGLDLTTAGTIGTAPSAAPAAGLTGGVARLDQALRHLSAYLGLRNQITLAAVTNNDPFIPRTDYLWKPVWLFTSTTGCPTVAPAYAIGSVYGYEITLTVNSRTYLYYANQDGTLLVLCINGQPHRSSIIPGSS